MASVLSTRLPAPTRAALAELAVIASEQYHVSASLALTMTVGGFNSATATMATARQFRLLCVDPATIHEAREKRLLQ